MARRTICYVLVAFFVLLTVSATVFSDELGSKSLKSDKGPTLEQTMEFIRQKLGVFFVDKYSVSKEMEGTPGVPDHSSSTFYDIVFSYKGCTMFLNYKQTDIVQYGKGYDTYLEELSAKADGWPPRKTTEPPETVSSQNRTIELNLKTVSDIKTDVSSDRMLGPRMREGVPVYNLLIQSEDGRTIEIPVRKQEYAERLANAFERAVQLCGGG